MDKERFSTYLQKYSYDCGAGAAAIILLNFGVTKVNHDALMYSLDVRRNGTNMHNLEIFFRRRNYDVLSKEGATVVDLRKELQKKKLCVVLYQGSGTKREIGKLEGGHYSVVAGVGSKYVYLLDPGVSEDYGDGIGWQRIKISDFKDRWQDKWKENGKEVYCEGWMLAVRPRRKKS